MGGIKIKQHDITDCGAACLASISAHYRLRIPIAKIRQYAGTGKNGTNVMGLLEAAEKLGFEAKGVRGDKESLARIPKPAIAHLCLANKLHHFVVIYRVSAKGITIMDPGTGKMSTWGTEAFQREWTGILVIMLPGENFKPGSETVSRWIRFWELIRPHRFMLFQSLIGSVFYTLLGFAISVYLQKITDHVWVNGDYRLLNLLSLLMLFLLLVRMVLSILKDIFLLRVGQEIDGRLIMGYYRHLLKLPQRFFDTMRVGEIVSRVNDAVKIRVFISNTSLSLSVNFFIVLFSFLILFTYYWKLGVIMLAAVPMYLLVYLITDRLNKRTERKIMEYSADLESQLVESLQTMSTIKQFGLEDLASVKTESRFVPLLRTGYSSSLNQVLSANTTQGISGFFTIALLWLGSYYVLRQEITPGELLSFYAIIGYFTTPVATLVSSNKIIQNALIAADRLFEIIDLDQEDSGSQNVLQPGLDGDIRFHKVSFRYGSGPYVLRDLDLIFRRGEITAVVGESGTGKSTLAHILQKLYPLDKGRVFFGELELGYIPNQSLRKAVAIVPQKMHLFNGTILENIALGEVQPNMAKVLNICKDLGLLAYIESLPNGFHTPVGENGTALSGGQKQRIAIARALYLEPGILVLDEAVSSLDSLSEKLVMDTLFSLRKSGVTIVLISHRLSAMLHADRIVVLGKEGVLEEGTHKDLLSKRSHYFNFWNHQSPFGLDHKGFDANSQML